MIVLETIGIALLFVVIAIVLTVVVAILSEYFKTSFALVFLIGFAIVVSIGASYEIARDRHSATPTTIEECNP